jgi:hypothetical protein
MSRTDNEIIPEKLLAMRKLHLHVSVSAVATVASVPADPGGLLRIVLYNETY